MCFTPNGVSPADTGSKKQCPNPEVKLSIKEPLSLFSRQESNDLNHTDFFKIFGTN